MLQLLRFTWHLMQFKLLQVMARTVVGIIMALARQAGSTGLLLHNRLVSGVLLSLMRWLKCIFVHYNSFPCIQTFTNNTHIDIP